MMSMVRRTVAPSLSRWCSRARVAKPEVSNDLPPSVLAALNRVMVHRRRGDTHSARRIVVQLPGSQGWYHGSEATSEAIAQRFPQLNAEQIDEASALLRSNVNARLRVLNRQERGANWATNW